MARIVVAGGSGFIGGHLIPTLLARGDEVIVLTRNAQYRPDRAGALLRHVQWDPGAQDEQWIGALARADAVVNLAGANIGSRRWTKKRKGALVNSRVRPTQAIVGAISRLDPAERPRVLVNASGIDYYGDRGEARLSEASAAGTSFLARLSLRWERAALDAERDGVRVVLVRTSVVLAPDALTLKLIAFPFRVLVGGPLGHGNQRFTWVHIDDLAAIYRRAIDDERLSGPVNAVAPNVPTQAEVARDVGSVLHRPSRVPTPAFVLRLAMGERADLLLHGRVAVPEVATRLGVTFRYPTLADALRACLVREGRRKPSPAEAISPFEPVLGGDVGRLPPQFRDQYLVRPGETERAVLRGAMGRIWHRPRWLWPVLRVLATLDIIFPEQGRNIEAEMTVDGVLDATGRSCQTWKRSFNLPRPRRFDATMSFDPALGRVVEWLRPRDLIEVVWDVAFEPPATIRIATERMRFGRGRRRVTLPRWLTPDVIATETAVGADEITIELVVRHRWLGDVFGYEGRFRVTRERIPNAP